MKRKGPIPPVKQQGHLSLNGSSPSYFTPILEDPCNITLGNTKHFSELDTVGTVYHLAICSPTRYTKFFMIEFIQHVC